jgi:SHS2 domain-containing protein
VEHLVLASISVEFDGDKRLHASGRGEQFQRERHGEGVQVKGVSYHMMEIEEGTDGKPCHVQVLFDI